jgi:hypothetical protein
MGMGLRVSASIVGALMGGTQCRPRRDVLVRSSRGNVQRVMTRLEPIVFMFGQSVASEGQEYFSGLTFLGL